MQASVEHQEPVVRLSSGAANEVRALLPREGPGRHLRVYVEKGGCSGLQYGLIFDECRPGDAISEQEGLSVLVDAFSADFVRGSGVDFDDSLNGGGFKLVNPNARQSCGCGKSFEA
jgi:iron-sulfur cluster assembly protein/iron-sulfur cluster insertion protein